MLLRTLANGKDAARAPAVECLGWVALRSDAEVVAALAKTLHNNLFTHPNFVFLDHKSVRDLLKSREPHSSEPLIVYNNLLRWAIFQLDKTLLEESEDGAKGAEIPVTERSKLITKIREEKIKDFTFADISKHLDNVLDLVPWQEMAQSDFVK